jgi:hypothetical protein
MLVRYPLTKIVPAFFSRYLFGAFYEMEFQKGADMKPPEEDSVSLFWRQS